MKADIFTSGVNPGWNLVLLMGYQFVENSTQIAKEYILGITLSVNM